MIQDAVVVAFCPGSHLPDLAVIRWRLTHLQPTTHCPMQFDSTRSVAQNVSTSRTGHLRADCRGCGRIRTVPAPPQHPTHLAFTCDAWGELPLPRFCMRTNGTMWWIQTIRIPRHRAATWAARILRNERWPRQVWITCARGTPSCRFVYPTDASLPGPCPQRSASSASIANTGGCHEEPCASTCSTESTSIRAPAPSCGGPIPGNDHR